MKRISRLVIIGLALFGCVALAQEFQEVAEPGYIGQPHLLNLDTAGLVPLEKQTAVRKRRAKALGYGGGTVGYELKGEKSPVRFEANKKLEFVVRVESLQISPDDLIQLVALKRKSRRRELVTTKIGVMGIGATTNPEAGALPFTAKQYGESSLRIVPSHTLPPGEYAIRVANAFDTFFCFGVDPAHK